MSEVNGQVKANKGRMVCELMAGPSLGGEERWLVESANECSKKFMVVERQQNLGWRNLGDGRNNGIYERSTNNLHSLLTHH